MQTAWHFMDIHKIYIWGRERERKEALIFFPGKVKVEIRFLMGIMAS